MPETVPTTPIAGPPAISPIASDCPTSEFTVALMLESSMLRLSHAA